ncbi:uncharacterized protein VTP21DRAFT_6998 [Calcarisporiella thermophila]|uniref:uncharacterized protein n=1 Tax=Calcarisporiella thermophila TaxID=911321 RepID=UPI003743A55B
MVSKTLFVVAASMAAVAVAQQPLTLPTIDTTPPAAPEWLSLVDASKVAKAPVGAKCAEGGADPFCHWTCTTCLRTNKTDVATCPKGQWALTFDDGPTEFTPALLDFLKQNNLKVTFFLMGSQVRKFPDLVKRAYAEGHELAGHTWSHTPLTTLTNEQIISELKWTEEAIFQAVGKRIKYIRPPQGDMDDRVRDIAAQLGYKIFQWDVDTNDWKIRSKEITIPQVIANFAKPIGEFATRQTGVLSLEHDHAKETVDIAISNIPKLVKAGYKPILASQCIGEASAYRDGPASSAASSLPASSSVVVPASSSSAAPVVSQSVVPQQVVPQANTQQASSKSSAPAAAQSAGPAKTSDASKVLGFGFLGFAGFVASLLL